MFIKIMVQALAEGLQSVTRAIAARPIKPILEGVLIETDEDGVYLTCTDGLLTIRTFVPAKVNTPGKTALPGKILTELIRKLPEGPVEIKINEKNSASIKCLSSRTNLACLPYQEFPQVILDDQEMVYSLPQNIFRDMIQKVIFAISSDDTRQILTGCLLEISGDEARLVCLDGFRLALQRHPAAFSLPKGTDRVSAVIPGKNMAEIGKILSDSDKPIQFSFDKTRLYAAIGDTRVSSVLLAGEYINYRQILPADWMIRAAVNCQIFESALERASLMAREGKNNRNLLKLSITAEDMTITSAAEMGDVREVLPVTAEGGEIEIAFNANYLKDVIRNVSDEEVSMRFNSNVSPCVICPVQGDGFLYLVLPIRVY